jgi:uncharacterized OsmC-like protein
MEDREFSLTVTREEAFAFSVQFDHTGLPQLTMDEPRPLGSGKGPNAARMLGAAVGHCLSASLLFCLEKSRVEVNGLETKVSGTIERNDKGRFRIGGIHVTLAPDVSADARDRMGRCLELFEDFCIVTASVKQGIDVTVEVEPQTATA